MSRLFYSQVERALTFTFPIRFSRKRHPITGVFLRHSALFPHGPIAQLVRARP